MATIDSLDIQIEGSAQKANVAINDLIKNLDRLANSLKIDTSGLEKIGKSLNLSGIDKAAKNVQSQTQKVSKSLSQIMEQYKDLGKGFEIKGSTQQIQKQIDTLTNKLANAKLAKDDFEASGKTNLGGYETAVKNVIKYTNQIESLKKQLAGLQTAQPKLDFNVAGAENATKFLIEYKKELMDFKNDMKSIGDVYGGLQNVPKGFLDTPIQNLKQSIEELKQSYPQETNVISAFEKELQKLQGISSGLTREPTRVNIDTNSIDKVSEKIAELKNRFEKVGSDFKFTGNFEQLNIEIEKVYSKLNELRTKEQEMISAGQVNTSGFEQLQESLARVGNKFGIMQDLRDRTEAFNQSLKQLRVPEIREENLTKLQNSLRKTEADTEKLRTKLSNAITMGRITPNIDDSGFRKLTEQIALSEKQAEALRKKIQEVGGGTSGTGSIMDRLKSSLSNVSSQSSKTSSSTNILSKNIKNLSSTMSGFSASAGKAITGMKSFARQALSAFGIYLGIYGAIRGIKKSVDIASDLTEVQNVVDVTFGDMAYKVEEFAKTSIEQFGMSELALKQISSRFQAMGTAMGFPVGKMSDMSIELTKLTADMASFYNVEQKAVAEDLESIFTGTTRPLRQYGLDLTQATLQEWAMKQGIDANIQSMSQAEKTMLRYQYVLANTGAAQGDFARTADTWANQVRILKQNFEQLASVIGGVLINAFKPLIKMLNTAMKYVIAFAQTLSNTLGKIFGWTYEGGSGGFVNDMSDAAGSAEDVAGGMSDAEKSAKKLKTHLLSIDELNVVEPDSGGSGGAGGGAGSGISEWDESEIEGGWKKIEEFSGNLLKFFDPLLSAWNSKGNFVMDSWKYALEEIWKLAKDIGRDFLRVWNQQETIDMFEDILQIIGDIGLTAGNLARNLRIAWNYNDTGFRILENIRDIFSVIIGNIREAADATVIWSGRLDFRPLMQAIEKFTKSLIPVADSLSGILSDFYITVLLPLSKWTIEKGLPNLLDVMTDLNNSINWDKIRNSFKELDKELLKISKFTFNALYDFIKNFLSPITKFTMNEALPFLVDTITDLSKKINWDSLNSALSALWEALSKFAVGMGNGIITFFEAIEPLLTSTIAELINQVALAIEFLGNVFNMIPDPIIEGFGSAIAAILTAFVAYQGVGEIVRTIGTGIESMCTAVSNGFALLTTHPYIAIAAGIAAVAGALVSMNKSAEEQEQIALFGEKLSNITNNINNAADAIRNRTQASQEYVQNAGLAESQMAKDLADRYFDLQEKERLTNEEKLEMQTLASKLVDTLPGLETYYNTETGLLDTTRESIEKLIDSRLREIQLKAVEEELTKAYQDRITAMNDLKAAAEPVEAAQSRMAELEQKYKDASDKTSLLQQYEDLSLKLQNCDGDTEELLEKQQELWNEITNGGTEEFPAFDSLHQKMAEASQEMYDFKDEYNQVMKNFGVSQEAYQGVEKNIAELTNMFTTGMTGAAQDGIDGFANKMNSDTETGDSMVTNAQKAFDAWKGTEGWDSHSPSKKTYQTAVDVIDGFNNGITENTQSSIAAITTWAASVSNAMKSALGIGDMAETTDPSTSMFGGIISNFTSTWSMFSETWTEYLESWKTSNEELYWGEEIWNTNWMNIYNTYLKVWAQFEKQWKTNFDKWWKIQIIPYFSVKQWTEFGENMRSGLYGGFRSIVNDVAGILNSMISVFDAAFTKLEKAMNKLIEDYNKAAKTMGTSTLSKVSYEKMGKISVPAYAAGGFPEDGLFYANHTELVGEFTNGRTAVANNDQIVAGIKAGVKEAVAEVLAPYLAEIASSNREIANKDMSVNIGDGDIVDAYKRGTARNGFDFSPVY